MSDLQKYAPVTATNGENPVATMMPDMDGRWLFDDDVEQSIKGLKSQLPASMQNCTIQFKECEKGHGRLTATNWAVAGCYVCERERHQRVIKDLEQKGRDIDYQSRLKDTKIRDLQVELKKEKDFWRIRNSH